jgi:hypothetical protein
LSEADKGLTEAEFLSILSQESDSEFLDRCNELIPSLVAPFDGEATKAISQLPTRSSEKRLSSLIFIPISHPSDNPALDVALRREVAEILENLARRGDLVASGEHVASPLNRATAQAFRASGLRRQMDAGVGPANEEVLKRVLARMAGFEAGLLDFLDSHPEVRAEGVDNQSAVFVGSALKTKPGLVQGDQDHQMARQLTYLLLIELRTRYALQRSRSLAPDGARVVFLQGRLHRAGVIEWCVRNHVVLREQSPPSLSTAAGA